MKKFFKKCIHKRWKQCSMQPKGGYYWLSTDAGSYPNVMHPYFDAALTCCWLTPRLWMLITEHWSSYVALENSGLSPHHTTLHQATTKGEKASNLQSMIAKGIGSQDVVEGWISLDRFPSASSVDENNDSQLATQCTYSTILKRKKKNTSTLFQVLQW